MAETSVRLLAADELPPAAKLVGRQMLGSVTDEVAQGWADVWGGNPTHGAFAGDELVGVAQWFGSWLATPGRPVPIAAVTAVSVLSNHRRQGHLSRLMEEQLRHAVDAHNAVAVLIAAEYPIYGRFGYGPAADACRIQLDTGAARFRDEPTGSITLVDAADLRAPLQAMHEARWAWTPGTMLRDDGVWDRVAGLVAWPHAPLEPGKQRGALWHDDAGQLGGAVVYKVEERWTGNRPDGIMEVDLLIGATPVAERELWRHLTTVDWCRTAKAGPRPVDDPLPLWLHDARAATLNDRSDNLWARILDVPAALGARRSAVPGATVLEVVDPLGHAAGRWKVELAPDGGEATPTTEPSDLRLGVSALSAAYLGAYTLVQLARAGLVDEERSGAVVDASALFATASAPWCPLGF